MADPATGAGYEQRLRRLAGGLLELARVRLELAGLEAREEAARWAELLLYGVLVAFLLVLGLGFLAMLLTVLLWDSQRLLALAVFATLFLTLGAVAAWAAWTRLARPSPLFGASVAELARDRAVLDPDGAGVAAGTDGGRGAG